MRTFQLKYGYLPGDIPDPAATQFGFSAVTARGTLRGEGDGNGLIEGSSNFSHSGWCSVGNAANYCNDSPTSGETLTFWIDLSTAKLIDGSFSGIASESFIAANANGVTGSALNLYFPQAKIGNGNYLYVWSGGYISGVAWSGYTGGNDGINYFGLEAITSIPSGAWAINLTATPGLTVNQAYKIDSKIDDGLPMTGNVLAQISQMGMAWAYGNPGNAWQANITSQAATDPYACFDNGAVNNATMKYSLSKNSNVYNCSLVFKFQ